MPLHVVAMYTASPGKQDEVESHLRAMLQPTRDEPGCLTYRVFRSENEPDSFAIVETYADDEALEYHQSTQHFETHITEGARKLIISRHVVVGRELEPPEESMRRAPLT